MLDESLVSADVNMEPTRKRRAARRLKPDAVPSIFPCSTERAERRRSSYFDQMERAEVSDVVW